MKMTKILNTKTLSVSVSEKKNFSLVLTDR